MKFKIISRNPKTQKLISDEHNSDRSADFEICIQCGKRTKILKSTPIELRKGFIAGCGQLCSDCTRIVALETHDPDFRPSNKEMCTLLSVCSEGEE